MREREKRSWNITACFPALAAYTTAAARSVYHVRILLPSDIVGRRRRLRPRSINVVVVGSYQASPPLSPSLRRNRLSAASIYFWLPRDRPTDRPTEAIARGRAIERVEPARANESDQSPARLPDRPAAAAADLLRTLHTERNSPSSANCVFPCALAPACRNFAVPSIPRSFVRSFGHRPIGKVWLFGIGKRQKEAKRLPL